MSGLNLWAKEGVEKVFFNFLATWGFLDYLFSSDLYPTGDGSLKRGRGYFTFIYAAMTTPYN